MADFSAIILPYQMIDVLSIFSNCKRFSIIFLVVLSCSSCNLIGVEAEKSDHLNDISKGYNYALEVAYGKNSNIKMDIHTPQTLEGNPAEVIILLHGGGWTTGEKRFLKPTVDILIGQRRNLAIINMDYHLKLDSTKGNLLQTQLADLAEAFAFLRQNAEKYNIRKDNFRIFGISAGAHIALMYAYTSGDAGIGAVVAGSAPTDLAIKEMLDRSLWTRVEKLTGKKYGQAENVFKEDSPLYVASARSPKTYLIYGLRDSLVSPIQGKVLADKLQLLNVPTLLNILNDEDHNLSPQRTAFYILRSYE